MHAQHVHVHVILLFGVSLEVLNPTEENGVIHIGELSFKIEQKIYYKILHTGAVHARYE